MIIVITIIIIYYMIIVIVNYYLPLHPRPHVLLEASPILIPLW